METNFSFSEVYEKNYDVILNYIRKRLYGRKENAEDITQQVFEKAFRLWNTYDPSKPMIGWLYVIANSVFIDYLRGVSNRIETSNDNYEKIRIVGADETDSIINKKTIRRIINNVFRNLNEKEQYVGYLFFKRECQYEEIVTLTGYPMGTVKGLIARIREKLQNVLIQEGIA